MKKKKKRFQEMEMRREGAVGACGVVVRTGRENSFLDDETMQVNVQNGKMAWYSLEKVNSSQSARTTFMSKI